MKLKLCNGLERMPNLLTQSPLVQVILALTCPL
jgi:hypothetical protein